MTALTMQEIFDRALFGLRKQGVKSIEPGGGCAYRGSAAGELKCGIGFCIDDDALAKSMDAVDDDSSIRNLMEEEEMPALLSLFDKVPMKFLVNIQDAHDSHMPLKKGNSLDVWEAEMWRLARFWDLTYTRPGHEY